MKKFVSYILILTLALALMACGTPEENFVSAIERYDDTKAVKCDFENKVTVTIEGETYENTFSGTTLINNKKEQFQVTGTSLTTYTGGKTEYSINTVLDDDVMYSTTNGESYRQKISFDDALVTLACYNVLHGVDSNSFASIEETSEAGNMRYTFSLNNDGALKLVGLKEQLARVMNQLGEGGTIAIKEVSGKIALDNRKRPESQDVTIVAEMTVVESTITISETIHTVFEMSGSNFDIAAPDGSADYKLLETD